MKQKLLAFALAGISGTALAQTNVTIQGAFDSGVQMFSTETAGVKTRTNRWGSSSNSTTSNFTFLVTEDLGGGMKAGLLLKSDPTAGSSSATGVWNSQNYLWLSGGFGKVSLGFMDNFANTTATTAQPFGTAMGGGWSSAFGRLNGVGTSSAGAVANVAVATAATAGTFAGARDIRVNNSIKWDSPSWSGFSGGLLYRSPNSAGNAAADSDGQTQLGLNYNNGPLNVSYAHSNFMTNVAGLNKGVATHNLLAANYKFGVVTLYGGWTSSKATGVNGAAAGGATSSVDARSWNVALKWQATSTIAVMANVLRSDDKLVADQDRSLNSLGLDYSLSKRTVAYARWEGGDNDKSATTGSTGGKFNRTAVGLRHSF